MEQGIVWFLPIEEEFIAWLQQLGAGTPLQQILIVLNNFFSFLGEETVCISVMGMLYWGFNKEKGARLGAAIVMTNVSIGLLKNIFARVRPWAASERIELLRDVDGFSFPSGHSANCTTLYPTVAYEYRKIKWLVPVAVIIPLLCGLSRCYVGAHWPTDVVVGWCTGLLVFVLMEFTLHKVKNKYTFYIILIVVCSVGLFYCTTNDYYNSYGMLIGMVPGFLFEEKLVRFENTKNPFLVILRTAVGGALYFGLNAAIKPVIGNIFPEGTQGYLLMRTVRYAVVIFLLVGVYPLSFRVEKIFRKKTEEEAL